MSEGFTVFGRVTQIEGRERDCTITVGPKGSIVKAEVRAVVAGARSGV